MATLQRQDTIMHTIKAGETCSQKLRSFFANGKKYMLYPFKILLFASRMKMYWKIVATDKHMLKTHCVKIWTLFLIR